MSSLVLCWVAYRNYHWSPLIIAADLDSAELRVVAALAKDQAWLETFAKGEKPHPQTCIELFGKPQAKGGEEYTFAKSLTYRFIYTLPGKIPASAGQLRLGKVDLSEMQLAEMTRKLDRAHPAIRRWKMETISKLHRTQRAYNIFGRFRDMRWALMTKDPHLREHAEQAALNFAVQTIVGKVINDSIIRLFQRIMVNPTLQGWMCLQCHDEIGCTTQDESELPWFAKNIKESIEVPIPELNNLVIPAEVKYGPNWGKMKEYKFGN